MTIKTYNLKDKNLIIGTRNLQDYFKDTTVDLIKNVDDKSQTVGINGNVTINKSNDKTYTLTFTLEANSADNDYMRGLYNSDTIFPCFYDDENTGEKVTLAGCAFLKNADKSDGWEIGGRLWNILVSTGQDVA